MRASQPRTPWPVTLVGAGPGDPELLTLKAVRAIAAADVILMDDLVNEEVLVHARSDARVIRLGKRGGCVSTPQAFIDRLMIQQARCGLRVVRLKGGDPFVFGRGGEEIEQLRSAGLEVVVINGITAGLAAATSLQTALTHRRLAHGVVFITGHSAPGEAEPDWTLLGQAAAALRLTLVVYMGPARAADNSVWSARLTVRGYCGGRGAARVTAQPTGCHHHVGAADRNPRLARPWQSLRHHHRRRVAGPGHPGACQ